MPVISTAIASVSAGTTQATGRRQNRQSSKFARWANQGLGMTA